MIPFHDISLLIIFIFCVEFQFFAAMVTNGIANTQYMKQ